MPFNEATFKKRWRALCEVGNIDPAEGVQSIYQEVNVRAALHPLADKLRYFEHRCDHPDDGKFHFEDAKLRPMEVHESNIEIWDVIELMPGIQDAWRVLNEEGVIPLRTIHQRQAEGEKRRDYHRRPRGKCYSKGRELSRTL